MDSPYEVRIRMYNVGFGDCFLLTFRYKNAKQKERHVLIDFGSTAAPLRRESQMLPAAEDIRDVTGGRLDAVVVTHRHADHISGFAPRKDGKGTGDIIRDISKDAVIIQPWTEDPELPKDARTRVAGGGSNAKALSALHVLSLDSMHSVARAVVTRIANLEAKEMESEEESAEQETPRIARAAARRRPAFIEHLSFLGETNLKNLPAVRNLQGMGRAHEYLSYGAPTTLEGKVLPGVKVHVLGPPTTEQHPDAATYAKESNEYWSLQAAAVRSSMTMQVEKLFPKQPSVQADALPKSARWFVKKVRTVQVQQLTELVRIVDSTMNNTSLILMFEVGGKLLLFPGDAQIENWDYSLNHAKRKAAHRKMLRDTDVYKVGHHGSLNATPKSLWALFKNKPKIVTLMSTRTGKHGSTKAHTEVPRTTLSDELETHSDFHNTMNCKAPNALFDEVTLKMRR
jgi:metallo-beta-lactamase superfamily protein